MQACYVETVEIALSPELNFGQLFIIDGFICERHDTEVSLVWEHQSLWLEEHVSSDDVSFQHTFVE